MALNVAPGQGRDVTAHSYVLRTLRDAIVSGSLAGGTRLVQAELAEQLGVSITPIREALRDLAGEGLVIVDPHKGSRVRTLDLDDVRELYALRIVLEPIMVRRVITSVTAEQLDRAQDLHVRLYETDDIVVWSELNKQFHAVLAESDQGSRLSSILTGMRDASSAYVSLSLGADTRRTTESNVEHGELVELYRRGDADAAVALTVQHLRTTLGVIEDAHKKGLL
ncbi:MAG TPA: GntR family transcriptional regulator [Gryllotalpicola sp.]